MSLSRMGFLSKDSKCYSFDSRGNGYGRGEGFGVLVIKRLSDALLSNDVIRAVVRATGSNQDGRTPGITQPSLTAQERLIKETYRKAALDMGITRFVEAHGTGTLVRLSWLLLSSNWVVSTCLRSIDWRSDRSQRHWQCIS